MRLEQGLKQRQLAELLGTDMPMYSKMELGARRVKRDQVPKLAELYKVDEKELMTLWLADGVYAVLKEEEMYALVIDPADGFDTGTVESWLETNNILWKQLNA